MVKKAHFVTGKGGVGKSLVAAAIARSLSPKSRQSEQKILLAELSEASFYDDFLKLDRIGYAPTHWTESIDICQWSGPECLKEYALYLLKIERLYQLFFENPVTRSLIQVAPGLQELAVLGKVTSSPRKQGPEMKYDQIVVDAYATGHFLSLMQAPAAMAEAVQFGPMGEQSRSIDRYLRDPNFTEIHVVTTAEELPITETIELCNSIKEFFSLEPKVYLNRLFNLSKKEIADLKPLAKDFLNLQIENEENAKKLLKKNGFNFIEFPLVNSLHPEKIIKSLLPILEINL